MPAVDQVHVTIIMPTCGVTRTVGKNVDGHSLGNTPGLFEYMMPELDAMAYGLLHKVKKMSIPGTISDQTPTTSIGLIQLQSLAGEVIRASKTPSVGLVNKTHN